MSALLDLFLHLDAHLAAAIVQYGAATYALLFVVIFLETGLVVTPFLPGDSLLFAAGALAASGGFSIPGLLILLCAAAILGDALNYWIGRKLGAKAMEQGKIFGLPVNRAHIERTSRFFETHGPHAIVLARFAPIIRTFAPFIAGVAGMQYRRFALYNVVGAVLWVLIFVLGGYFFGNLPVVKEHFTFVILGIIAVSLIPAAVAYVRAKPRRI